MAKSPRTQATSVKPLPFAEQTRLVLPGSEKAPVPGAIHVKATPAKSTVTVSLILKRKEPLNLHLRDGRSIGPVRVTNAEFNRHHTADPHVIKQVTDFAHEFNLQVQEPATGSRTMHLT